MILKIPDDISASVAIVLYTIKNKDLVQVLIELQEKNYIDKNYKLTQKGKLAVNKIKTISKDEESVKSLAIAYRDCFKDEHGRALKPGVTGNLQSLQERLKEFKESYDYTDDHILKAIKMYIKTEAMNGFKYLQKSHYTVKKKTGSDWDSRLLTFCEELESEGNVEENKFGTEL